MMRRLLLLALAAIPPRVLNRLQAFKQRHPRLRRAAETGSRWVREDVTEIRTGPARGLRIDAGSGKLGYALGHNEPAVQERLSTLLHPAAVFYDLGANVGFFTLLGAKLVGPGGFVYAFEPVPALAEALRRNVAMNGFENVTVIEKAASDKRGRGALVATADPTGTQVAPEADGEVELVPIDELVYNGAVYPPAVMKIDVEGAEVAVLCGARRTLETYCPIVVCELHGTEGEFSALMVSLGYKVEVLDDGGGTDNPHVLAVPPR